MKKKSDIAKLKVMSISLKLREKRTIYMLLFVVLFYFMTTIFEYKVMDLKL